MFSALESTHNHAWDESDLHALLNMVDTQVEAKEELSNLVTELKSLLETDTNLRLAQKIIKQSGMTVELMQFINYNNILSRHIPQVPSLESMSLDISVSDSQVAQEALGEKIKEIGGRISKLFTRVTSQLGAAMGFNKSIIARADILKEDIQGKTYSEEDAKIVQIKVLTPSDLLKKVKLNSEMVKFVTATADKPFPSTKDDSERFVAKLKEVEAEFKFDKADAQHQSLADAGYRSSDFDKIHHALTTGIHEVLAFGQTIDKKLTSLDNEINFRNMGKDEAIHYKYVSYSAFIETFFKIDAEVGKINRFAIATLGVLARTYR